MGIPANKILSIQKPDPEVVYNIMLQHFRQFRYNWLNVMTDEMKAEYLASRRQRATEEDISCSLAYIESLDEDHKDQILELAMHVNRGLLDYSCQDNDLFDGFKMGVYADYLIVRLQGG
jgi:hypothetical protein